MERLQGVAIEADLLARALARLPDHELDADASHPAYEVWCGYLRLMDALAALRGETNTDKQENEDGRDIG